MTFQQELNRLIDTFDYIEKYEIDLSQGSMPSLDFHKSRQNLYVQQWEFGVKQVEQLVNSLHVPEEYEPLLKRIKEAVITLHEKDRTLIAPALETLKELSQKLPEEEQLIKLPSLPGDIKDEIAADAEELAKCFRSGCFRSVVVLCGRILEVALHRKYYEATGNDLLEKSPGIGLGNVIAKMKEKELQFDPGLTQQIHLINQVRVFSVHKKQQPFVPSRSQAQAIILYTMDVLQQLFS